MHEELAKRLKEKAGTFDYDGRPDIACDYEQAADAIEELTHENKELSFRSAQLEAMNDALIGETGAADALMVVSQPRWIPVTERKPKTDDIVIVAIHDDSGDTPYDVTNVGFYLDVFPLGIWVVENERCNYVTHWMPLPSTEGLNET